MYLVNIVNVLDEFFFRCNYLFLCYRQKSITWASCIILILWNLLVTASRTNIGFWFTSFWLRAVWIIIYLGVSYWFSFKFLYDTIECLKLTYLLFFGSGASYFQPLSWTIRMKVALDAAKGLAYLHSDEAKVIYRDFKTANILLDSVSKSHCSYDSIVIMGYSYIPFCWWQSYNAKLSDFGLAKDGPAGDKSHVSTRVMGTYGYAAPEYMATGTKLYKVLIATNSNVQLVSRKNLAVRTWLDTSQVWHVFLSFCVGHLTKKSDVYSFGVVLLEIMSGKRALDNNRPSGEHNLIEWAKPYLNSKRRIFQVMDARIEGQYTVRQAMKVANLAIQCLSVEPRFRPKMDEVVIALEELQGSSDVSAGEAGSSRDHQNVKRSGHSSRSNGPRQHRSNKQSETIINEKWMM